LGLETRLLRVETAGPMNRIEERFAQLKKQGRRGFVVYIGAGDPDLSATIEFARAFDQAGVDVLELGVPFSDPLADGIVNQLAAQRGLASGTTPEKVLQAVASMRLSTQIPVVLYIYFNLIHRYGLEKFVRDAATAGVDGLLVLDLPPEESREYERLMGQSGLSNIYLVAPTTPEDRIKLIVNHARGFIYYVSREGVTGMRQEVSGSVGTMIPLIRKHTNLPVAVGFGVSTPEQARAVAETADAVVVGSAIVDRIAKLGTERGGSKEVTEFVKTLAEAIKSV
jgi:tryptophan synthase alpha chain